MDTALHNYKMLSIKSGLQFKSNITQVNFSTLQKKCILNGILQLLLQSNYVITQHHSITLFFCILLCQI